ncbi:MAG TPA: hypothetical protein VLI54_04865 [Bacillota bacterium]|nr:hypothetical protein [Bacillota bacterium]
MNEQRFGQILTVVNPGGRHAALAGAMVDDLREHYGKSRVEVVQSVPNATEHRDMVQNKIAKMGEGTWMAVCSGDAILGNTLTAVADSEIKRRYGIIGIGALACGTKCDGQRAFLPNTKGWAPHEVFERGQPTPFRTGICTVTPKRMPPLFTLRYGLYASAISTPNGAAYANSKKMREAGGPNWCRDLKIARYTIEHAQQARILRPQGHEVITGKLTDLIVPNITYMAGRHLRGTTINDCRGTHVFTVPAEMPTTEKLLRFWEGTLPSHHYPEGFGVEVEDEIRLQCDGETAITRVADLSPNDRKRYGPDDQIIIPASSKLVFQRSAAECYPLTTLHGAA